MARSDFFGSRFPIVAVAMNKVSDVGLAVAVHEAGAFPSLSSFNFYRDGLLDFGWLRAELQQFKSLTGSTRVLLSLSARDFLSRPMERLLVEEGFLFVELFSRQTDDPVWTQARVRAAYLTTWHGMKVVYKIHRAITAIDMNLETVILKGRDGAGRTTPDAGTLEENFEQIRQNRPMTGVVPSGGISTPEQVRHFIERGAFAVGVGTLFAASEESCVSRETKLKMVESTTADLKRFGRLDHQGLRFSDIGPDDDNNTRSLVTGMTNPERGAIFAGKGIDQIRRIAPVGEIVAFLTASLAEK